MKLVVEAAGAEQHRGAIGNLACGVGVEGADKRRARPFSGRPARHRGVGLVHVHDIEAPLAERAAGGGRPLSEHGQVGHRAVRRQADRAAERDQIVGQLAPLGPRALVTDPREAVIGINRCEQPHVVALVDKLGGKRLDVPSDAPGIRVGIR